ncbi:hypothetical protein Hs30E_06830 [Lactococcus hodotermopsidis]|uniref:Nitrogenase/oxidoreductase component 1 domain-containing protein n=2 Tax=Pseudolactococcus hodotermopsidis TaxID=2709157 RepID=A0A6A0B9T3_9LACT|nr:hypothetical protein Hs30E_06830 [Lactococcus hodotermopsidis]
MSQLCVTLPPFAPDYSGVCSALFELGGLIVIHDASGCTGNYTGYDEPRWYNSKSFVYCSRLREIDAVLGDDEKLIQKIKVAAEALKPEFIAILGSPVPMLIGTDFTGIAMEIEERLGIPTFGFDTTGQLFYHQGISLALVALAKKYIKAPEQKKKQQLNILGASPLDFGINDNITQIKSFFVDNNYEIGACFAMGTTIDDIKNAATAALNVVISHSGLALAKLMARKYDIPYICGIPIGAGTTLLRKMTTLVAEPLELDVEKETLIIHDQIIANSIRESLACPKKVVVASCFDLEQTLKSEGDFVMKTEKEIMTAVNAGYKRVIGDPLVLSLIKDETVEKIALPHEAVSSKIYRKDYPIFRNFKL